MRYATPAVPVVAALCLASAACGDDEAAGDATTTTPDTGTSDADTADTTPEGDATSSDADTDTRPSNTSCLGWDRPPPGWAGRFAAWPAERVPDVVAPVALAAVPNVPGRYVVGDRSGVLTSFSATGPLASRVPLDLRGQGGLSSALVLLGLAHHPAFPTPADFYALVVDQTAGTLVLVRLAAIPEGFTVSGTATLGPAPASASGWMGFGPIDHHLYIGVPASGEDDASRLADPSGKVWRVALADGAGDALFGVPDDNPFPAAAHPAVFALGLRDPAYGGFDAETGELWVIDRGAAVDEVNRVVAGAGYGAPCFEGPAPGATTACGDSAATDAPVIRSPHTAGTALVGGFVYRGAERPGLVGTYVYAKSGGGLFGLVGGLPPEVVIDADAPPLVALAPDAAGEVIGLGADGALWKLGAPGPSAHPIPETLAGTGCMDAADPSRAGPALVPYDVNVALWSDGADKQRWFAIPDGTTITVQPDGEWRFPIGAVLVKSFAFDGQTIETRFLVRHADGDWAGYSYAWDGDTPRLVDPGGATRVVAGGLTWSYPSQGQCLFCHTAPTLDYARERALGLDSTQLDDGQGQLERFADGGWLSVQGALHPERALPAVDDAAAPLEDRARAYLDANCSNCHQPGGTGQGPDFRYERPLGEAGICGAAPLGSNWGIAGAKIVDPGSPATSLVSFRMHAAPPAVGRMPPIGTILVDPDGAALVDAWIASLTGCPE